MVNGNTNVGVESRSCKHRNASGQERAWRASSAPYLIGPTGEFVHTVEDFETNLDRFAATKDPTVCRGWVLRNMSDEMSARIFLKYAAI